MDPIQTSDDSSLLNQTQTKGNILSIIKHRLIFFFLLLLLLPALIYLFQFVKEKVISPAVPEEKEFSLIESSPEDQESSFSTVRQPTLVFSKKLGISQKDISSYISISPKPLGSWHLEKNKQVIYFSADQKQTDKLPSTLTYDTIYIINIKKNLISHDGKKLKKDVSIEFKTKKNALFGIFANNKLISASPGEKTTASFSTFGENLPLQNNSYTVTIQEASEDQLISYFSAKENKPPLYRYEDNPNNKTIMRLDKTLSINQTNNTYTDIEIPPLDSTGIYHVVIKNPYGSDDFFINTSRHVTEAFIDENTMYVWVNDGNGKSLPNVEVKFFVKGPTKPALLETQTTNSQGLVKLEKNIKDIVFIITMANKDIAVTNTRNLYDYYPSYSSNSNNSLIAYSYVDRPVYRPGDTVHYKAIIRKHGDGEYSLPSGTVYLRLGTEYEYSSRNDDKEYTKLDIDGNGTVTNDVVLPKSIDHQYPPFIYLYSKNGDSYSNIDSLPLHIESYRKPDMETTATTAEIEYISGDDSHMKVLVKTLYGSPLSNTDFSYRVLVNDYTEIKDRSLENLAYYGSYGYGDTLINGSSKLDKKGVADITFSTHLKEKELSQIATLEVTPNIGASPSIGRIAKLIHRGDFAIFFDKVNADLQNGITGTIEILNHEQQRKPVKNQSVNLELYNNKNYQEMILVDSQDLPPTDDLGKTTFTFINVSSGSYVLKATSKDQRGNTITARYPIYVSQAEVAQVLEKPQFIFYTKINQGSYNPGDTAQVTLKANFPITDSIAVVTSNRKGDIALSFSQIHIDEESTTFPISIPNNQVYPLNVSFYTTYKKQVFTTSTTLEIDKERKQISTKLSFSPQRVKPGDSVTAQIETKDNNGNPVSADTSLSVIDGSLLQITDWNNVILFDHFYKYLSSLSLAHFNSTQGISNYGGGGGGGCFLAGTKIRMSNGSLKNIEEVTIGNAIKARASENTSAITTDKVTKTFRHVVSDYLTINKFLNITPVHRIFVNNKWQQASDIKIGDNLVDEYGNYIKVESIEKHEGTFVVYNLTTEKTHTFFADGIYVHNEKGEELRKNFVDTAYWNPHIQTDKNGQAKVTIKVPDNLTTFSAQMFANTQDSKLGQDATEFVSYKDVVIIPTVPNFYYQGDKPILSALLQNNQDKDIDVSLSMAIKDINFSNTQLLKVKKGDFESISAPSEISTSKNSIKILFEAKDRQTGKLLDSVLLEKPVLSKGDIKTSWQSFEGPREFEFSPQFPSLDANRMTVTTTLHPASDLLTNSYFQIYANASETGQSLFVWSYILAKTRDGAIAPHLYKYAKLKNDLREAMDTVLSKKSSDGIWIPAYNSSESETQITLWIAQGLKQAQKYDVFPEVSNLTGIAEKAINHIKSSSYQIASGIVQDIYKSVPNTNPQPDKTNEELIKLWVLGTTPTNTALNETSDFIAVRALRNEQGALLKLRKIILPSSQDRYLWADGTTLPVLAMVEKGSPADAQKAIRGFSTESQNYYSSGILGLLASAEHAVNSNYAISAEIPSISINGNPTLDLTQTLASKNFQTGIIKVKIDKEKATLPFFTTVIQTQLSDKNIMKNDAKVLSINLVRKKKTTSAALLQEAPVGTTVVIELSAQSPFKKQAFANNYSYRFPLQITESISPGFMYLNQESGNSPQDQGALSKLYLDRSNYQMPNDASDQVVFFDGSASDNILLFPYVVYNISGGSYYQPKTNIIFPNLGLQIEEK